MTAVLLNCADVSNRLYAYVDDTLPGTERRVVEAHLNGCARCRQELAEIQAVETQLRALWRASPAPSADLWRRARAKIRPPAAAPRRPRRAVLVLAGAMVAAVAIGIGWRAIDIGGIEERVVVEPMEELRAYVDSRRPLDVATTDMAQLRQWFRDKVDYALPEPRTEAGVRLTGGRLCFFLDRRIASLMYKSDGRVLSLYVIPEERFSLGGRAERSVAGERVIVRKAGGYAQVMWQRDGFVYALVGELAPERLVEIAPEFLHATRGPA